MNPVTSIFGAAVAARNLLYDRRVLPARHLQGPVVSVGNISVGGTGKTPFVIFLGTELERRGIAFDVLSRGYGRTTRGVLEVDPAGSPATFGDEPLIIARQLGVPVIVGEDRYSAGLYAEQRFGPKLHLLDDGFQHRSLARDFDIVLIAPEDATDRLLPAGRLREPVKCLRRADAIVTCDGADPALFPMHGKMLWRAMRRVLVKDIPPRPVAFCGIARPQQFFLQLRVAGIDVAAEAVFRDHHRYTERDLRDLNSLRERSLGEGFVTTEKDAVNLGSHVARLQPIAFVGLKMDIVQPADALDSMLRILQERRGKHEKIVRTPS